MGTPDFAAVILDAVHAAGHEILAAVTQPDRPKGRGKAMAMSDVKMRAMELGIPVLQPERVRNNEEFAESIRSMHPDVIVVAAFGQILPKEILERERFLMFYPLHYDSYSIGYLALSDISEASQSNLHKSLFNFMEVAFENVRKKCLLRQFNAMLESLSIHDGLTGLYNRVGYERYARATFERLLENEGGVRILFADLDKLKAINDRWGHEAGDEAIRLAAEVLREPCRGDDFLMRYGGDEFLVIASCRETELEQRYRENLERRCRRDGFPGTVSVSVGSVTAHRGDPKPPTLDDLIRRADVLMYERKRGRRIATAAREIPREDE
jgi:diguanylate cyclase (GGDEF)-like protein